MNLKEFDLDLPYVEDINKIESVIKDTKCSFSEARRYDYENNWREKRRLFRLQTRCISSMLERVFCNIKTKDCWKILIECVEVINEERIINLSGVCTVQVAFNPIEFFESSDYIKKQITFKLLTEGIRKVIQEKNFNPNSFEEAFNMILKSDFRNEWVWKKPVRSPDKKYNAEILCIHGISKIDIYLIIRDKDNNEVTRTKLISEIPDEFAYVKHLGKIKWISNKRVMVTNRKEDYSWSIDI